MNCPVCGNDLSLPDKLKETTELHYDCPSCFSSLFLRGSKCEVLSRGTVSDELPGGETGEEAAVEGVVPSLNESDSDENTEQEPADPPQALAEEAVSEADPPVAPASSSPEAGGPVEEVLPETPEIPEIPALKETAETGPEMSDPSSGGEEGATLPASAAGSDPPSEEANSPSASSVEAGPESFEFTEESAENSEDVPLSAKQPSVPETALSKEKQELTAEQDREEDFSDVEKFGNSPTPAGKGVFYYNVTVEEMDSADLRAGAEEVLEDPALKLAPEQLDMSVQEGRLRISKISPVQAHVIVKSLLGLSLKISWEQHLVADSPPESAPVESD